MLNVKVNTWTIMSVSRPDGGGTVSITSRVVEPVSSALEHLRAMGEGKPEPVYDVSSGGWRWTWETVLPNGVTNTDTVRIF